jgi:hypothetical protein
VRFTACCARCVRRLVPAGCEHCSGSSGPRQLTSDTCVRRREFSSHRRGAAHLAPRHFQVSEEAGRAYSYARLASPLLVSPRTGGLRDVVACCERARCAPHARSLACWLRGRRRGLQRTMAESGLAEVISLSLKAGALYDKTHFARSVQKWRSALAAAEALGAEDCVIVAIFKTELARASFDCEGASHGRFSQAFVLEMLDLHAASAAILRRRRDAGTLLEGKCRPSRGRVFRVPGKRAVARTTRAGCPVEMRPDKTCWLRRVPEPLQQLHELVLRGDG